MQWFQIKEQSAGEKRLVLTWFLYKIFGKKILYIISGLVSFFTFLFASKVRFYSKKYFKVIQQKIGISPSLINQFRHIHAYADSLVDKMLVYSGGFDIKDISFENKKSEQELFEDINKKKGVFFICNHIGNIEVLQSLLCDESKPDININVFMSNKQSQIFNRFLESLKIEFPINLFPVEDMDINTGVELKENLNKGDLVFIAGDRLAQNNYKKSYKVQIFNHDILLPKGAFRLAKIMDVPIYFISAVKCHGRYKIVLESQKGKNEKELVDSYTKFLEKIIMQYPFQFFHFYDVFQD